MNVQIRALKPLQVRGVNTPAGETVTTDEAETRQLIRDGLTVPAGLLHGGAVRVARRSVG